MLLNVHSTLFFNCFSLFSSQRNNSCITSFRAISLSCHECFIRDYRYHAFIRYVRTSYCLEQLIRQRHKFFNPLWLSMWREFRDTSNCKGWENCWLSCGLSRHQNSTANDDSFNLSLTSWIWQSRQYWCFKWSDCKTWKNNVILWEAASLTQNI